MNKNASVSGLRTPTDISAQDAASIAEALNRLVADHFALYVKTKNFHWHMSGPHFRDYHLLLDDQSTQILATVDPLAERARKIGEPTVKSVGAIARLTTVKDNDEEFVAPRQMLKELAHDNESLAASMRAAHGRCDKASDSGTAGLLETFIDEAETRIWFLFETRRTK